MSCRWYYCSVDAIVLSHTIATDEPAASCLQLFEKLAVFVIFLVLILVIFVVPHPCNFRRSSSLSFSSFLIIVVFVVLVLVIFVVLLLVIVIGGENGRGSGEAD